MTELSKEDSYIVIYVMKNKIQKDLFYNIQQKNDSWQKDAAVVIQMEFFAINKLNRRETSRECTDTKFFSFWMQNICTI